MTITARPPASRLDRPTTRALALAVADAGWFTTENLFREVPRDRAATLLLKCLDYLNAWRRGWAPWTWHRPLVEQDPGLWQRELILPSGWMKRFPRLGMRPIARTIRRWREAHAPDGPLALVMTYPHYLYLRDMVRPDLQVYFNLDDYTLYWPKAAEQVRALELRAVRESDLTVCVSRFRADRLREAVPEAADRVRHLPHGVPTSMLAEHPWDRPAPPPDDLAAIPGPRLGFVGSLEDRIDWALLTRLSEALPHASIVIVGRIVPLGDDAWHDDCRRCLARPNVHAIGWRPQERIHEYNRAFDVCLIPYRTDHPFNIACSPTKIMDCMGSSRPVVSTAIPECRLYDELFDVAESDAGFIAAVQSILDRGSDDGRAEARHEFARRNTCACMVERFLSWLPA
jgi:teichuronic acid biosynthesis glycosyltransferase TuaH